jgi:hypothetical protein
MSLVRRATLGLLLLSIWQLLGAGSLWAQGATSDMSPPASEIDTGFHLLYELKFAEAREHFQGFANTHPDDPLADVSIAASYLFEEFWRQGVLTSDFFLNDKRFLSGIAGKPDEEQTQRFQQANGRARETALRRLQADPHDADALYVLTLSTGMQADYVGILEKHQLESVHFIKEADGYAKELLKLRPDAQDAWLALGASDYILGSLSAPKRFMLRFGGVHGNKKVGLDELGRAAANGRYLKPYAKMLLALASLREKQPDVARTLLAELADEFPANPIFAAELVRLSGAASRAGS